MKKDELTMFNCPCGASFIGFKVAFSRHIPKCPVYKRAVEILKKDVAKKKRKSRPKNSLITS
jgi:hypothetical protein